MDAYKVLSTVKNGQLLIDMPTNFDNTDVEVIVLQVVRSAANDAQTPLSKRINGVIDEERIEKIDTSTSALSELKLGGRMSKETAADLHLQLKKMREEWD